MLLTVVYLTSREDPKFQWFADGLVREYKTLGDHPDKPELQVIVVDARLWYDDESSRRQSFKDAVRGRFDFQHVPPKPTVWQGPTRLTQRDYFAAANARNTGFALARGSHVAFVDDLSVLMPGWLSGHVHAMVHKYVMCGSTSKNKFLEVDDQGLLVKYEFFGPGKDSRAVIERESSNIGCGGNWLYGGTFSVPLAAALSVNGQDEIYDSIGGEDYDFGIRLQRVGCLFFFNRSCGTVESEELHHGYTPMIRLDKPAPVDGPFGSNVLYNRLLNGNETWTMQKTFVLSEIRKRVLGGEPFPVPTEPSRYWLDGQLLSEMKNTTTGF